MAKPSADAIAIAASNLVLAQVTQTNSSSLRRLPGGYNVVTSYMRIAAAISAHDVEAGAVEPSGDSEE